MESKEKYMKYIYGILILSLSVSAFSDTYFYKLGIDEGSGIKFLSGSSKQSPEELKKSLMTDGFTKLSNLFYFEKSETGPQLKTWDVWNKYLMPERLIRNRSIVSIQPYKGNPFKVAGIEYPLNQVAGGI